MNIKPSLSVIRADSVQEGLVLQLQVPGGEHHKNMALPNTYAYSPLINSHDHLIGNWVPRAGDKRPYPSSHYWVEDMKHSFSFKERNRFWVNDGSFQLSEPEAIQLAALGCYKSLFSGCSIVHDHAPLQEDSYYDQMPLLVVRHYRQCHSITLGNWWGGRTAREEMKLTAGRIPFIIHLGEGVDEVTKAEFSELTKEGLLQPNTLLIHGIAFSRKEIERTAKAGASICWCPTSNYYLIGKTLNINAALAAGVNVCLGTDSTMSGGINLIDEFLKIRETHPAISARTMYQMCTANAARALMLPAQYASLDPEHTSNLLLVEAVDKDPFENLLELDASTIDLLVLDGIPRYGNSEWLEILSLNEDDYTVFRTGHKEKFVLGDPQQINDRIDAALGYHKDFPYLPF